MKHAVALAALAMTACALEPTPLPAPASLGQYWAERNPDRVVPVVVEAIMAAPAFPQVPALISVDTLRGSND